MRTKIENSVLVKFKAYGKEQVGLWIDNVITAEETCNGWGSFTLALVLVNNSFEIVLHNDMTLMEEQPMTRED